MKIILAIQKVKNQLLRKLKEIAYRYFFMDERSRGKKPLGKFKFFNANILVKNSLRKARSKKKNINHNKA